MSTKAKATYRDSSRPARTSQPARQSRRAIPLFFVRVEPFVVPKKSLTGAGTEQVDTRVLQVIYAADAAASNLYVGQQLDVYLDAGQ